MTSLPRNQVTTAKVDEITEESIIEREPKGVIKPSSWITHT